MNNNPGISGCEPLDANFMFPKNECCPAEDHEDTTMKHLVKYTVWQL